MVSEAKLNKMFKGLDSLEPNAAIAKAASKFKLSKSTVKNYYSEWRSNYMGEKLVDSVKENKSATNKKSVQTKNEHTVSKEDTKENLGLTIQEIRLNGVNGEYRVCKEGIELHGEEQTLAFQNIKQWEEFKAEIDSVFEYGKSNKILAS
ncbi:hypothetical protein [Clostridium felsineum]|uniref:Uncharacterized protein n=1 Tax=Clostridium felsineum TaxID=36839 RepID=A0A1S8L0K7_9CLOT|nr:hypothetical protein [Clostridium felsineum]URZ06446.1 hypothetical protein CLROS_017790 [Clostridium felsineum]URZ11481.1 hypothetical protein CROST_021980 [Clostridium felsineum]